MIIVEMRGGLGNQMFQYALGRSLSLRHDVILKLDVSNYTSALGDPVKGVRLFSLSHFNIECEIASVDDRKKFGIYHSPNYIGKAVRKINRFGDYFRKSYIVEPEKFFFSFDHNFISHPIKKDVYISGYWQSEKYFDEYHEVLKKELTVKNPAQGKNKTFIENVKYQNAIAVHIRHGDNANGIAKNHGVLSMDFYAQAIAIIKEKVFSPVFYLFSDDIPWAKEQLAYLDPLTVVDWNNDDTNYEDMRLMCACKHHIIANSTFSWWGAWLGAREGQIVIAPAKYHQTSNESYPDYYPSHWNIV